MTRFTLYEYYDLERLPEHTLQGDGEVSPENGWTIYLDTNNNGQLDDGEPSTTTGYHEEFGSGYYEFPELAFATYTVREEVPEGYYQVEPGYSYQWNDSGGSGDTTIILPELATLEQNSLPLNVYSMTRYDNVEVPLPFTFEFYGRKFDSLIVDAKSATLHFPSGYYDSEIDDLDDAQFLIGPFISEDLMSEYTIFSQDGELYANIFENYVFTSYNPQQQYFAITFFNYTFGNGDEFEQLPLDGGYYFDTNITFSVYLYRNGDIVFHYYDGPEEEGEGFAKVAQFLDDCEYCNNVEIGLAGPSYRYEDVDYYYNTYDFGGLPTRPDQNEGNWLVKFSPVRNSEALPANGEVVTLSEYCTESVVNFVNIYDNAVCFSGSVYKIFEGEDTESMEGVIVYIDLNQDGDRDQDEPYTTSDEYGDFQFGTCDDDFERIGKGLPAESPSQSEQLNLLPGIYQVRVEPTEGYQQEAPNKTHRLLAVSTNPLQVKPNFARIHPASLGAYDYEFYFQPRDTEQKSRRGYDSYNVSRYESVSWLYYQAETDGVPTGPKIPLTQSSLADILVLEDGRILFSGTLYERSNVPPEEPETLPRETRNGVASVPEGAYFGILSSDGRVTPIGPSYADEESGQVVDGLFTWEDEVYGFLQQDYFDEAGPVDLVAINVETGTITRTVQSDLFAESDYKVLGVAKVPADPTEQLIALVQPYFTEEMEECESSLPAELMHLRFASEGEGGGTWQMIPLVDYTDFDFELPSYLFGGAITWYKPYGKLLVSGLNGQKFLNLACAATIESGEEIFFSQIGSENHIYSFYIDIYEDDVDEFDYSIDSLDYETETYALLSNNGLAILESPTQAHEIHIGWESAIWVNDELEDGVESGEFYLKLEEDVEGSLPPGVIAVDGSASGANNGSSWPDAFTTLQAALAAAAGATAENPVEIWVADGTYVPGGQATDTFGLRNHVALYGGFLGGETTRNARDATNALTILSGQNICYHVVTANNCNATAVLDGFVVREGRANGVGDFSSGGGIFISSGSPTMAQVTISNNYASRSGGGVYVKNGSPAFTNVTFAENISRLYGGALYLDAAPAQLDRVSFFDNIVTYNGGAIYASRSGYTVTNGLFLGNRATRMGGAIHHYLSTGVTIQSCTITRNDSGRTGLGGGISTDSYSTVTLRNNIIWANTAKSFPEIYSQKLVNVTVTNNIIKTGYSPSTNTWVTDPLLDAEGRPDAASPAKGKAVLPLPAMDRDGNSRDGSNDLGAFQVPESGVVLEL